LSFRANDSDEYWLTAATLLDWQEQLWPWHRGVGPLVSGITFPRKYVYHVRNVIFTTSLTFHMFLLSSVYNRPNGNFTQALTAKNLSPFACRGVHVVSALSYNIFSCTKYPSAVLAQSTRHSKMSPKGKWNISAINSGVVKNSTQNN
jgi:hypothetical protein